MSPLRPDTPSRVAVGMSGGLDSSAVAALLVERGMDVMGLTLHLFKEGSRCCSAEDVERSRKVCEKLGIRHYVINAVDEFHNTIIAPFIEEYARGRTPSPCVLCNQHIKFGALLRRAQQLGCSHIATGHYVRTVRRADGWHLYKARDARKDQSYFLHRLSQEQLAQSLFPLEDMTKDEVRAFAMKKDLPISPRGESQDLCFITDAGPGPFVEQYHPELKREGFIINGEGRVLGRHGGFHRFTIGQREGLGIAAPSRLYVRELRPDTNTVVVGCREEIMADACLVEDMHWTTPTPPQDGDTCIVRLRYRHDGVAATLKLRDNGVIEVAFRQPQFAVTPGQAAVFYGNDDEVLGGGWIGKTNLGPET